MKILYLDTSSSFLYTAILDNEKVIDEIKEKLDKDLSSFALPGIDSMLKNNNMEISDIEKVIVVNGPGSFTGIRIGLAIAKTLAWAKNIPIIEISSLEAMVYSCDMNVNYLVPAIDARRGFVFAAIYDAVNNNFVMSERYISITTLEVALANLKGNIAYMSNDKIDTNYEVVKYVPNFLNIVKNVKDRESINPHSVDANYLKLTEAEEKHDN